jgi:hypothetical protein
MTRRKAFPSAILSLTNLTDWPGNEPGFRSEKPGTNIVALEVWTGPGLRRGPSLGLGLVAQTMFGLRPGPGLVQMISNVM